ncbi:potassium channel family protein [Aestuariicella sp. G3-2]|uniref:potassium channel family protein n=1 Tax=Pseudomaricurvus albidus TaxID=2842452 RepID=UPI001C0C5F77|nr:potassium channel family protein [Aestuariicella albida]MBU3070550.1 potassium channel family protein [Aestuariicella albida]
MKIMPFLGLAGPDNSENQRALICYRILEWPLLAAGFWMLGIWYEGSVLHNPQFMNTRLDIALWSMFVLETSLMLLLVDNRRRYIRNNWMNMAIIVAGLPMLLGVESYFGALRLLRLLILLDLTVHMGSSLARLLTRNALLPTFLGSAIVVVMAGFVISEIDTAIDDAGDGIWWAWVTITTVGYGDIVPTSTVGRIFAGLLMLIGLGLVSLLTANIAAFIIERSSHADARRIRKAEARDIARLEQQLNRLEKKLDQLTKDREN